VTQEGPFSLYLCRFVLAPDEFDSPFCRLFPFRTMMNRFLFFKPHAFAPLQISYVPIDISKQQQRFGPPDSPFPPQSMALVSAVFPFFPLGSSRPVAIWTISSKEGWFDHPGGRPPLFRLSSPRCLLGRAPPKIFAPIFLRPLSFFFSSFWRFRSVSLERIRKSDRLGSQCLVPADLC